MDVELGMNPRGRANRVFDAVAGRIYFRRWLDASLQGLREASERGLRAPG